MPINFSGSSGSGSIGGSGYSFSGSSGSGSVGSGSGGSGYYWSGSTGQCGGQFGGEFSGSIVVGLTSSFRNADYGVSVCTGTMLVHTYTAAAPSHHGQVGQKLFVALSGSAIGAADGLGRNAWIYITGSEGCTGAEPSTFIGIP